MVALWRWHVTVLDGAAVVASRAPSPSALAGAARAILPLLARDRLVINILLQADAFGILVWCLIARVLWFHVAGRSLLSHLRPDSKTEVNWQPIESPSVDSWLVCVVAISFVSLQQKPRLVCYSG